MGHCKNEIVLAVKEVMKNDLRSDLVKERFSLKMIRICIVMRENQRMSKDTDCFLRLYARAS